MSALLSQCSVGEGGKHSCWSKKDHIQCSHLLSAYPLINFTERESWKTKLSDGNTCVNLWHVRSPPRHMCVSYTCVGEYFLRYVLTVSWLHKQASLCRARTFLWRQISILNQLLFSWFFCHKLWCQNGDSWGRKLCILSSFVLSFTEGGLTCTGLGICSPDLWSHPNSKSKWPVSWIHPSLTCAGLWCVGVSQE